jgi:23S rRNA pseudouridine2605 synthase
LLEPGNNPWYEMVLVQGRNRQIRIMFEAIGHLVMKLRRVAIGPLRLGRLTAGQYRELADWEVRRLRRGSRRSAP